MPRALCLLWKFPLLYIAHYSVQFVDIKMKPWTEADFFMLFIPIFLFLFRTFFSSLFHFTLPPLSYWIIQKFSFFHLPVRFTWFTYNENLPRSVWELSENFFLCYTSALQFTALCLKSFMYVKLKALTHTLLIWQWLDDDDEK